MADLEETFLKKNIPGKYSQWDVSDGEEETKETSSHAKLQPSSAINRGSVNTGVKGVLSDYRRSKESERVHRSLEQNPIDQHESNIRQTSTCLESEKQDFFEKQLTSPHSDSDSDSDDDYGDDEFLKTYMESRMVAMRNQATERLVLDCLTEINSLQEFSNVTDDTDPNLFCIFHLYDARISQCKLIDEHCSRIAPRMKKCANFFRMKMSLVKPNFDPIGFPCILIYKGGIEIANLTPITKFFRHSGSRDRFSCEEVEHILKCHGVCNFE